MDVQKTIGGSLQISTEVLAKIARLAALEIDGVAEVTTGGSQNVRGLLGRTGLQKPVNVVPVSYTHLTLPTILRV